MSTTAKRVKDAKSRSFSRASTTAASCAAARARFCASSAYALCFRGLALRGEIPGVVKSSCRGDARHILNTLGVPRHGQPHHLRWFSGLTQARANGG